MKILYIFTYDDRLEASKEVFWVILRKKNLDYLNTNVRTTILDNILLIY